MNVHVILFLTITIIGLPYGKETKTINQRRDIHSLVKKAFKNAKKVVMFDAKQKYDLHQKGDDTFKESSSEGQLDLFNSEDDVAVKEEHHAMLLLEAAKSLYKEGIKLSDFHQRKDYVEAWKTVAKDYRPKTKKIKCDCSSVYRTVDGSCNNLLHPEWGKSDTIEPRFLEPVYSDGIDAPRVLSVTGKLLPSARTISNILMQCDAEKHSETNTVMVMAFGQFLDHDITMTPVSKGENGSSIKCCGVKEKREECLPIDIPDNDPYFKKSNCMNFVRSAEAVSPQAHNFPPQREQLNQVTSYIDASAVYGSTLEKMNGLRKFERGLLKTGKHGLLPEGAPHSCRLTNSRESCMDAGDKRVNVAPNLIMLHLVFVLEHNRIAGQLGLINPMWDDERVFQESRKIMSAFVQQISYDEYLRTVLNEETLLKHDLLTTEEGFSHSYNKSVNPSVRNEFSAAAFRFGHSQITSFQSYYKKDSTRANFRIEQTYFNPHVVQVHEGKHTPDLGRWLVTGTAAESDRCFVKGVKDKLFFDKWKKSFDLPALNIQRGRDHGIPAYVKWRTWCGLSNVTTFQSVHGGLVNHDAETAALLKRLHEKVGDIDLFTGGMTEKPLPGADVGPTFSCIIAHQFQFIKQGDRFWFENDDCKTGFTLEQLKEIKKMKLSKIMCENLKLDTIQQNVFIIPNDNGNRLKACCDLADVDLSYWKDKRK